MHIFIIIIIITLYSSMSFSKVF